MNYTQQEKNQYIINKCLEIKSTNLYDIFQELASSEFVSIHGPEHHVLDGACILLAYYNAGGKINLKNALNQMLERGIQMPGAICGHWGVCGAVTSIGAALSIIEETGPLSSKSWGNHMKVTSKALEELANIGGPRCCKRDGLIALKTTVQYMQEQYNVNIQWTEPNCSFFPKNEQCIKNTCPFYPQKKLKIAFICIHNSCRSQMAEALCKKYAGNIFEAYSAGTVKLPQINQDAVRIIKQEYGISMGEEYYSKLFEEIPAVDIVVTMGCNVSCPTGFSAKHHIMWSFDDPTGKDDKTFIQTAKKIKENILELASQHWE